MLPDSFDGDVRTGSDNLDQRLKLYSLTAMAAGVSVMALAPPAEAEVIITKKTIPIPVNSYFGAYVPPTPISMMNNGVNDFSFSLYSFDYHGFKGSLWMWPTEGGAVEADNTFGFRFYVSNLTKGAKIGPSAHFSSHNDAMVEQVVSYNYESIGKWGGDNANHYIGVKFLANGETHYGWIRITVDAAHALSATITAWAYETVPNLKLVAGETSAQAEVQQPSAPSLGMLALGTSGLRMWRH